MALKTVSLQSANIVVAIHINTQYSQQNCCYNGLKQVKSISSFAEMTVEKYRFFSIVRLSDIVDMSVMLHEAQNFLPDGKEVIFTGGDELRGQEIALCDRT